ncbi:MAG: rhomboid family intramembrane serine protease [Elusimicrobiota bacterium]|nr:rhomboid family intramembrane serine protease [Elusimicrobiota bacterium]
MIPLKDNIPSRRIPIVNYLLIALNTAVFVLELKIASRSTVLFQEFIFEYGLIPMRFITNFPNDFPTVFTAMFLHGGWIHFIGNMLYLYIFGDNVEDKLGHLTYIVFYCFCGLAAAGTQTIFSLASRVPMIGASGAIGGVLGAYFLLFPRARILTLIPFGIFTRIAEIPAFFYLGFWFVIQFLSGTLSLATPSMYTVGSGIAFWAHIGGFLTGVYWIILFYRRR